MRDAPDNDASPGSVSHSIEAGLSDAALVALGDTAFAGLRSVVLAVSGGADSMTLMLMAQRWRAARPDIELQIHVATVDHALRDGSRADAEWVVQEARHAGFDAHLLTWLGPRPTSGLQATAREARYGLLLDLIKRLHLEAPVGLILGHHLDDQAETFLMRLARGSGIDGLAGMQAERAIERGQNIRLVRPFLQLGKQRLVRTLSERGRPWREDPSNENADFERVRARKTIKLLSEYGLEADAIGVSAQRLERARQALELATDHLARAALKTHAGAYGEIATGPFDKAPAEIRLRLIRRVLRLYGNATEPPRMTRLEALTDRLSGPSAQTLAGCQLQRDADHILAWREPGRRGLATLELARGEAQIWDNRFIVAADPSVAGPLEVGPLSSTELRGLLDKGCSLDSLKAGIPRRAALTLPCVRRNGQLLAVGHPAFADPSTSLVSIKFIGDITTA